jgi:uridine kinase
MASAPPTVSAVRARLLGEIAQLIPLPAHPDGVRVAVDGVDGVGKSTFARQLSATVSDSGRAVVHVSADDFHHPRVRRHARGRDSPEGFWLDSYDHEALVSDVLRPFGPGGSRRFRPAVHDLDTDAVLDAPWHTAAPGTVLVVDGLFLHRDELRDCWEFSLFLDAPVRTTVARMARRDGSHPDPSHPSLARYLGGQRLYAAACDPRRRATIVVDNTDLDRPTIVDVHRRPPTPAPEGPTA